MQKKNSMLDINKQLTESIHASRSNWSEYSHFSVPAVVQYNADAGPELMHNAVADPNNPNIFNTLQSVITTSPKREWHEIDAGIDEGTFSGHYRSQLLKRIYTLQQQAWTTTTQVTYLTMAESEGIILVVFVVCTLVFTYHRMRSLNYRTGSIDE